MSKHRKKISGASRATAFVVIPAAAIAFSGSGIAAAAPSQGGVTTAPAAPATQGGVTTAPAAPATQGGVTTAPAAPAEPEYWGPPPAVQPPYVPKPGYDYGTRQQTYPSTPDYTPPLNPGAFSPGTVYEPAAMYIAPEKTIMIGDIHIDQPNWISDRDVDRTNNTSELIRTEVSNFWRSTGVEPERADRVAAGQVTGTAGGALAGVVAVGVPAATVGGLIGGTIGGLAGGAVGMTLIPGVGWVPGGTVGTIGGAIIGAAALGVPGAIIGGVAGGTAGFVAGTAFGAGDDEGEPIEIELPDIDQPAITADTEAVVQNWEASPPAGPAAVDVVRAVMDTAPVVDQQVRDFVASHPGGDDFIASVDQALNELGASTATIGLPLGMISEAIGTGIQA